MSFLGNLLWIVLGGLLLAIEWFLAGLICCITIVGIPFGIQCMKIAGLVLAPFGKHIVYKSVGAGSTVGNILWIIFFGLGLALNAALFGLILCITIVGIPFGKQCFKFARLALTPFGAIVE